MCIRRCATKLGISVAVAVFLMCMFISPAKAQRMAPDGTWHQDTRGGLRMAPNGKYVPKSGYPGSVRPRVTWGELRPRRRGYYPPNVKRYNPRTNRWE